MNSTVNRSRFLITRSLVCKINAVEKKTFRKGINYTLTKILTAIAYHLATIAYKWKATVGEIKNKEMKNLNVKVYITGFFINIPGAIFIRVASRCNIGNQ